MLAQLQRQESQIGNSDPLHADLPGLAVAMEAALKDCQAVNDTVRRLERALGVAEQQELRGLEQSAFLRARMNARALKQRLRDRLRQRKFEISRMERSYRHSVNGESLASDM